MTSLYAANAAACQYLNECAGGGLPLTGFDLVTFIIVAAVLLAIGVYIAHELRAKRG